MVIILPSADFSANNIGQVETQIVINPFTEAAITASGNTTMTNEEKAALNTFFKTVGAFGTDSEIWSKLRYVFLPFIAGDLAYALVDYKTNLPLVTPGSNWIMQNNGLFPQASAAYNIALVDKFGGPDLSVLWYKCDAGISDAASDESIIGAGLRGKTNTSLWLGPIKEQVNSAGTAFQLKGVDLSNTVTWAKDLDAKGTKGVSISGTSGYFKRPGLSAPSAISLSNSLQEFTGETQVQLYIGGPASKHSLGALVIGDYLTSAEMLRLSNAMDSLGDYFVV